MAMNYAWQERKKFAIPVAAGVAVLLIWYLFVLSGINRDADRAAAETMVRIACIGSSQGTCGAGDIRLSNRRAEPTAVNCARLSSGVASRR